MTPFFEIAGWTLIHFVWQGTAIGLATAVALKLAAHRSPNVRYVVACTGLALMVAAPIATARLLTRSGFSRTVGYDKDGNVTCRLLEAAKPWRSGHAAEGDADRDARSSPASAGPY